MFLQHWESPTIVGMSLQTSMELLQLEWGFDTCPILEDFHPVGSLCTHLWLRSFWECTKYFEVTIALDSLPIPKPRVHNEVLN